MGFKNNLGSSLKDILQENVPNLPKKVSLKMPDISKIKMPKKSKKEKVNG